MDLKTLVTTYSRSSHDIAFRQRALRAQLLFWLKRLSIAVLTIWVVVSATFYIIRLMPGNPVDALITRLMEKDDLSYPEAQLRASAMLNLHLDTPLPEQYLEFVQNLLHLSLGNSIVVDPGYPVKELVLAHLLWTLSSMIIPLLVSFVLGVLLGAIAGWYRNTWFDHLLVTSAALLDALPAFLISIAIILLLGVIWKIIPLPGILETTLKLSEKPSITPTYLFMVFNDALKHLPTLLIAYIFSTTGRWALSMKSSTISVLDENYVRIAEARGLPLLPIIVNYVGRLAILPLLTGLMLSFNLVVSTSILIETVFRYPGIGSLLVVAIERRDYPLLQGIFVSITLIVVLLNLLADWLCRLLDPRIRALEES